MDRRDLLFIAGMFGSFVSIFLCLIVAVVPRAAQDRARARRLPDARMNARLLRLNI